MKADRLLFLQGGLCFYCRRKLDPAKATVEHVIPGSMGGKGDESNIVACCRAINALFANLPPKRKLETLIAWRGRVPCPERNGPELEKPGESTSTLQSKSWR
jgi:hypothetical protein